MSNLADNNNAILLPVVYTRSWNIPEKHRNIKIEVTEQLGSEAVNLVYNYNLVFL